MVYYLLVLVKKSMSEFQCHNEFANVLYTSCLDRVTSVKLSPSVQFQSFVLSGSVLSVVLTD